MRLAIECRVYLRLFGMLNNSICRHITLYTTFSYSSDHTHKDFLAIEIEIEV